MPKLTKTQTAQIMNAIRAEASDSFKASIPTASAMDYTAVGAVIMETGHANEFLNALVDKIGLTIIKSPQPSNIFERFKKGVMPYGFSIEEIFVDIANALTFNPATAESEVFKRIIPDVKAKYHTVNRKDFYKVTVSREQLQHAFTTEQGLANLISRIVESLLKGDINDEYNLTKKLLVDHNTDVGYNVINVVDPKASEANMKAFVKKAREVSRQFTFMSGAYNKAGITTNCPKERQIIIIDAAMEAALDVDVLASAFNMTQAEFLAQRVVVDSFTYTTSKGETGTLAGVHALLVDSDFLMVYDNDFASDTIWNPEGRYWNYFLHHWQVMATSGFVNAVAFKTGA